MITTQTPLRVSLLGGGSDYPHTADRLGAVVVGSAVRQFVYVAVRWLPQYHPHNFRIVYHQTELVHEVGDIQHPVVRAVLGEFDLENRGLEIIYYADLPGRSGMGSSSAFLVGLLHALSALLGKTLHASRLYEKAIEIEQEKLQEAVGYQDSAWAVFGGLAAIEFLPRKEKRGEAIVHRIPVQADLEAHSLLAFRGARTFDSQSVAGKYAKTDILESHAYRMIALAHEGRQALLGADWEKLGGLLDRAWAEKRKLQGVSDSQTDLLYERCRLAGAWGGKLLGAGGGGMLFFLAPPARQKRLQEILEESGCILVPYEICQWGSRIIHAD